MFNLFGNKTSSISASEAKELLSQGKDVVLLDVRTPQEHTSIRIPNSVLVPVDSIGTGIGKVVSDKDKQIIVYCQSGMRALSAAARLKSMGYTNVKNLGGIINWPYETVSGK